jgi:hypothetical protein
MMQGCHFEYTFSLHSAEFRILRGFFFLYVKTMVMQQLLTVAELQTNFWAGLGKVLHSRFFFQTLEVLPGQHKGNNECSLAFWLVKLVTGLCL